MEPVLENRYTLNRKMLTEYARKAGVGPRPWYWLWVSPLIVFCILCAFHPYFPNLRGNSILILVFVMLLSYLPELYAFRCVRRLKKQNGGTVPETLVSFGDAIEIQEGEASMKVDYSQIKKVKRLKQSYVLLIGRRTGILVDYYGFTEGSYLELVEFLREKRPDLKIPL